MRAAGWGVCWLPEGLVADDLRDGRLALASRDPAWHLPIELRVYRHRGDGRPVVAKLWDALKTMGEGVGVAGRGTAPLGGGLAAGWGSRAMTQERQNWTHTAGRIVIATSFGPIGLIMAGTGRPAPCFGPWPQWRARAGADRRDRQCHLDRGWRVVAPELPNRSPIPGSGPPERVTFSGHTQAATEV